MSNTSNAKKLTPKQSKFVDAYLETGNATESVIQAGYDTDRKVATVMGVENLAKPNIKLAIAEKKQDLQAEFKRQANKAMEVMVELMQNAKSENVRQQAAKDILDRAGFKPTDTVVNNVNVSRTDDVIKRARLLSTDDVSSQETDDTKL